MPRRGEGVEQLEFREFYRASQRDCLRTVLACVGDRQLAEDLVAEAYARAWASWAKVARHPAPRAWIVRTALNTRVSWWRRRRREIVVDGVPEAAAVEPPRGLDPGLLAALRELPRRQREVIALRVFLDLDTRATAKALGIAEGTVTAHMSRAVTTLRAQWMTAEARGS
ncbi:sigma-70 family RNA polymerase sigma factor [Streptomyces sp. NPDC050095]|uniref:sigma-70 family RNA polymerase sigma factor n=1 Tax=unclassified Streptomyces TaxID=2593676 RepID=UPI0034406CF0